MADGRPSGVASRQQRRWLFASCVFDEANWTLVVRGRRVAIETKPLELLRELLLRSGHVVSKERLLDSVWPAVTVVEASLPTAVRKLRRAMGDDRIIETVSGIGYRLAVPVELQKLEPAEVAAAPQLPLAMTALPRGPAIGARLLSITGALAIVFAALAVAYGPSQVAVSKAAPIPKPKDAAVAIRELDIPAIKTLIAAGWNAAAPWDKEGNDALGILLNHCEWDRAHDRRQMLLMARTMIEAGAPIDRRNVWGDTAYSIAKAPRYCGPDHPVTQMLEAMCYGGSMGPRDKCLATYELTAKQRRAQGLPPKAQDSRQRVS